MLPPSEYKQGIPFFTKLVWSLLFSYRYHIAAVRSAGSRYYVACLLLHRANISHAVTSCYSVHTHIIMYTGASCNHWPVDVKCLSFIVHTLFHAVLFHTSRPIRTRAAVTPNSTSSSWEFVVQRAVGLQQVDRKSITCNKSIASQHVDKLYILLPDRSATNRASGVSDTTVILFINLVNRLSHCYVSLFHILANFDPNMCILSRGVTTFCVFFGTTPSILRQTLALNAMLIDIRGYPIVFWRWPPNRKRRPTIRCRQRQNSKFDFMVDELKDSVCRRLRRLSTWNYELIHCQNHFPDTLRERVRLLLANCQ